MIFPKIRIYRALHKSGMANEAQIKVINDKLGNDREAQANFLKLWRQNMGHRFIGSLNSLGRWLKLHWPEIKIALGIVALFLDEEPKKIEEKPKKKRVRKPRKKSDPANAFGNMGISAEQAHKNLSAINDGLHQPEAIKDNE